ncbi:hypothetical protein CcaverHIS002_0608700 [Cutaneotrichosporon cavernicola]|uniref:MFS general substrate transporter n=1 Tax=Cutaneotrichosporon cavernicola TaxID=279322 RepID=A0AA48L8Z0_9TREE|nr:uncharacterized protein CcaverHIS019_0608150 [Cutaneotrichosporon cavernicola]BEI86583.1 hypothetical protein CcaverHIS002_0608700 [Cutaneotrichosporon cavernicola]BEI94356.1 hypothetical protein CcaverHIS019_0608150 [Cutaneotrichosporon cavernicola]BEJ02133.1 hypothetical protein CcaverHIS631_0608150 [Cutaneotrichosporon cavernicola]BEJ09894.1 hypothetical protein CcaverHIS641_0608090 [Cutaneotrichosporon cavernicola]
MATNGGLPALDAEEKSKIPDSPSLNPTEDSPTEDSAPAHTLDPPDGGLQAWLCIAGCFLMQFVQFGLINTFGVFQDYYEKTILSTTSPDTIAWIGGVQQFLLFFGGLVVGRWFDAHGAHVLIIPGSIIIVLSLMFVSLSTKFYQLMLCQGVLFGIGSALIFHPTIAVPGHWFRRRRALAMAIVGASSGAGGTVWPIAFNELINKIGFPWALRTAGFIALALFSIGCALVRTRLPRKTPTTWAKVFQPFREVPFILLTASVSAVFWGLYSPFFYVSGRAAQLGASSSLAFYCVSFINAASTVGRMLASAGDHWGAFNVLITAASGMTIVCFAFWIPLHTVAQVVACAATYGLFVGMYIAIIPACIATTGPAHEIGLRVGILWAVVAVFSLTGPPINGAFVNKHTTTDGFVTDAGYRAVGIFTGVVCLVGAMCAMGSKFRVSGRVGGIL